MWKGPSPKSPVLGFSITCTPHGLLSQILLSSPGLAPPVPADPLSSPLELLFGSSPPSRAAESLPRPKHPKIPSKDPSSSCSSRSLLISPGGRASIPSRGGAMSPPRATRFSQCCLGLITGSNYGPSAPSWEHGLPNPWHPSPASVRCRRLLPLHDRLYHKDYF